MCLQRTGTYIHTHHTYTTLSLCLSFWFMSVTRCVPRSLPVNFQDGSLVRQYPERYTQEWVSHIEISDNIIYSASQYDNVVYMFDIAKSVLVWIIYVCVYGKF